MWCVDVLGFKLFEFTDSFNCLISPPHSLAHLPWGRYLDQTFRTTKLRLTKSILAACRKVLLHRVQARCQQCAVLRQHSCPVRLCCHAVQQG